MKILTKFRLVFLITAILAMISPPEARAGVADIDLTWGRDASVSFHNGRACLNMNFLIYNNTAGADALADTYVSINGENILWMENWSISSQGSSGTKYCNVRFMKYADRMWVTTKDGAMQPTSSTRVSISENTSTNKTYMYVWFYLPENLLNKQLNVRIQGKAYDYNGTTPYDATEVVSTTFTRPELDYKVFGWESDGYYHIRANKITGMTSESYHDVMIYGRWRGESNWFHLRNVSYGDYNTNGDKVIDSDYYISKNDLQSNGLNASRWAAGVEFRVRFIYKAYRDKGLTTYDYTTSPSQGQRFSSIDGNNLYISQNNRDINFSWNVSSYNSSSGQSSAPFVIEEYDESSKKWKSLTEVPFDYSKRHYEWTRTLSNQEVNTGAFNKKYRVWRRFFSNPGVYSEYMSSSDKYFSYNTDYKKSSFVSINQIPETTTAEVKWTNEASGLWDNSASFVLNVTDKTTQERKTYTVPYDENSVVIDGLQGCKYYVVTLETKVNGSPYNSVTYKTSAGEDFQTPDNGVREIRNFQVSKGYYNDNVMISWEVPADKSDFKYFNIYRTSVKSGDEIHVTQIQHSGLTKYAYQDKAMAAGEIYNYTLEGYSVCLDKPVIGQSESSVGFSQPYATVSGRITYEGDVAVKGATVAVVGDESSSSYRSLNFTGKDASSVVPIPYDVYRFTGRDKSVTFQAWVRPTEFLNDSNYVLHTNNSCNDIYMKRSGELYLTMLGEQIATGYIMTPKMWHHISLVTDLSKMPAGTVTLYINGKKHNTYQVTDALELARPKLLNINLGSNGVDCGFTGNIDEIRFWGFGLGEQQVADNFNAFINGREEGLTAYYRCDNDGVDELFDLSGYKGKFNRNDTKLGAMVKFDTEVPKPDQLANKTVTDHNGNYLISTVPYTSEGVQYNVTPLMGIHKFSPDKRPIYASPSSVTFNGVDFEDKSSFEVSGSVLYENTLYPVEGCELYVDGIICARDGQVIRTDEKGEFKISVPIGDHFIEVRKQGHVFANAGRIPADPRGTGVRDTYDQPVHGLKFHDITKVTVAGRVSGGKIEDAKPLGLLQSKNNIGKAVITLSTGYKMNVDEIREEGSSSYVDAANDLRYAASTKNISSTAVVGSNDPQKVATITITTDPVTGEFAAEMPPVMYKIESVKIPSNPDLVFSKDKISSIDATNVMISETDSIETDEGMLSFEYNVAKKINYIVEKPSFTVSHNSDGSFGDKEFDFYTLTSEKPEKVSLYSVDEGGKVTYTFGSPIFTQQKRYTFDLYGYEKYVNYDDAEPVVDEVPLQNVVVTITNQFSADQEVYVGNGTTPETENVDGTFVNPDNLAANQISLDESGRAKYQFMTGYPNIVAPHQLGLNMVYNIDGREMQWEGNETFKAIVLGSLPSGNNFVTSGPDKILMILRDPAGSGSAAYFEKGVSVSTTENDGGTFVTNNEVSTVTSFGVDAGTVTGAFPGTAIISEASTAFDLEVGAEVNVETGKYNESVTTTTITERISTSDTEDFVGPNGDVFIGAATNMIFGNARSVQIRKVEGNFVVNKQDEISVGQNFTTGFKFTQNYIENVLIPNLYLNRNAKIQHVESYEGIVNNGTSPIYVSTLNPDDPRYGSDNFDEEVWGEQAVKRSDLVGPSYHMIVPTLKPTDLYQDTVRWFNTQIELWEKTLADNERAKVEAIQNKALYFKENHSFDAGAIIESSITQTTAATTHTDYMVEEFLVIGGGHGFDLNGTGLAVSAKTHTGGREFGFDEETQENSITTGYVLSEAGYNDALTVDVYDAPDGFGPIFSTQGGQTSCPYEDAVVTKYYNPGTEISAATMRVEIPNITVDNAYATDVPSGKAANFTLKLNNLSETGDDVWFDLAVDDDSNSSAAITIDGATITKARPILVKAGQTITKVLQLKQTKLDVLDFRNINVVLKSQCQGDPTGNFDVIADTVALSATFVPSCSDITLQIEDRVVNSYTGTILPIVIRDYDRSFVNFKGIRLQYKTDNDPDWVLIKEYVVDPADVKNDNELLEAAKINFNFDMTEKKFYPDGKYTFRAITICKFGNEEVHNESDIITVIKDVERPQLLGNPSPANGVLTADGEVSVTFNEDIKSSSLDERVNFVVRGRLNGYRVDHNTAVRFTGNAGASTQADIDLSNHSFAFNMWLNPSAEGAGQILAHGNATNKFTVECDAAGIITVAYAGRSYKAANAIPLDRWSFLSISYDNETNILAAYAFNDASTVVLIENVSATPYSGNGILKLGDGFKGIIHEVTLWNYARPAVEAQNQMYAAKSPKTPNLIGYWRMDEGHGDVALDLVRNRHIYFGDGSAWYIAVENKAVALDGTAHLSMNTARISPNDIDDIMFELWFNAEAEQGEVATLFSTGKGFGVEMRNGELVLIGKNGNISLGSDKFNDNTWHHLAVNVLRNGMTSVFVDGKVLKQIASVNIGSASSDAYVIGADRRHPADNPNTFEYFNHFTGLVDEVRLWNASLSADFIRGNRFNRLLGDATGLIAYYPFEKVEMNDAGQVKVLFDLADHSLNKSGEMAAAETAESQLAPGLKAAAALKNVEFGFVASERKVVINIEEAADIIEGTTLEFTLREVKDLTDNYSQPITWTAFVQRNLLRWAESGVEIVKNNLDEASFSAAITNNSGIGENWTLQNVPYWLTPEISGDFIAPLTEQEIRFSISESLPIGSYEETIYLVGNNQIYEPFVVNVEVTGQEPEWAVVPSDYESSMNIIGQLQYNGRYAESENDIIGAFVDNICVGMASPIYYIDYDAYFVHMNIYGNAETNGKPVVFKVWESATGNVYPVVETSEEVNYQESRIVGGLKVPFIWNATDKVEQSIALNRNWTWVSTFIKNSENSIAQVFEGIEDNTRIVKDKDSFASYSSALGWDGSLKDFTANKMYKVNAVKACAVKVVGNAITPSEYPVTIKHPWNWIGYNASFNSSVADAFAGLNPQEDDIVKDQNSFSIYNGYKWIGTLSTLVPGRGYMYKSATEAERTFTFPDKPAAQRKAQMKVIRNANEHFTSVDNAKYPGNMTMVAIVKDGDQIVYENEVGIFAGKECRGAAVSNEDGLLFITVAGENNGDKLVIKVYTASETKEAKNGLVYVDDAMHGTLDEPYVIQLGKMPTDVDNAGTDAVEIFVENGVLNINNAGEYQLFNAAGQLIYTGAETQHVLPQGVYMIQIGDETRKVVL